jgi:hypothetical protein
LMSISRRRKGTRTPSIGIASAVAMASAQRTCHACGSRPPRPRRRFSRPHFPRCPAKLSRKNPCRKN